MGKKLDTKLTTYLRRSNNNYVNLYLHFGSYSFEVVPHCRSVKETAMFYKLLKESDLMDSE